MSLRMVLKSTDSASTHSDNKPYNFRVRLPRSLPLTGEWTVELTEFCNDSIGRLSDKEIFVYCSICEDTIIGECQGPLLRRIYLIDSKNQIFFSPLPHSFTHQRPYWPTHLYKGQKRGRCVIFNWRFNCYTRISTTVKIMSGPTYISSPALWEQFQHTDGGENYSNDSTQSAERWGVA